jgi:flagellum-specific peptidoglycan hydrolase FlgJ
MTPAQNDFLHRAYDAASQAGHIFAEMAACEAALESRYGTSELAAKDNNLFGMKQHQHPVYGTQVLPTREWLDGKWAAVNSSWIVYPDWKTCFADRMATLKRLAPAYPHYKNALAAASATTYVMEVSRTWSTDPAWVCSCGEIFLASADSASHIVSNPTHQSMLIPGEGRAEKVLAIYDAIAGNWSATETNSP